VTPKKGGSGRIQKGREESLVEIQKKPERYSFTQTSEWGVRVPCVGAMKRRERIQAGSRTESGVDPRGKTCYQVARSEGASCLENSISRKIRNDRREGVAGTAWLELGGEPYDCYLSARGSKDDKGWVSQQRKEKTQSNPRRIYRGG